MSAFMLCSANCWPQAAHRSLRWSSWSPVWVGSGSRWGRTWSGPLTASGPRTAAAASPSSPASFLPPAGRSAPSRKRQSGARWPKTCRRSCPRRCFCDLSPCSSAWRRASAASPSWRGRTCWPSCCSSWTGCWPRSDPGPSSSSPAWTPRRTSCSRRARSLSSANSVTEFTEKARD